MNLSQSIGWNRIPGFLLLSLALGLFGFAQNNLSQDVTLRLENILSGKYPRGGATWIGATCESGDLPFSGDLVLYPGQEDPPLHRWVVPVELPPNTKKTWTVPVFLGAGGFGRVKGDLIQKGNKLASHGTAANEANGHLIMLLSGEAPAWKGGAEERSFDPIWPASGFDLPQRTDAYSGYGAVVADASWLLKQPAALMDTLTKVAERGGTLILALGAQGPDLAQRGLSPTLARAIGRTTSTVPLEGEDTFLAITPLVGGYQAQDFPEGWARWVALGRGRVLLIAPGLADWVVADPETPILAIAKTLGLHQPLDEDKPQVDQEIHQLQSLAEQFRGKHAAPFLILTGLLLVFLLAAGPGEYFFLRRKKRYALTYITYPILVGGFTLAIGGIAILFQDYRIAAQAIVFQDNLAGENAPGLSLMTLYPNKFKAIKAQVEPGHLLPMAAQSGMSASDLAVSWDINFAPKKDNWLVELRTWVPSSFLVEQPALTYQPPALEDDLSKYPLAGNLEKGFLLVLEYGGGNLVEGIGVHWYRPGQKPGDKMRIEHHQLLSTYLRDVFSRYGYNGYDYGFSESRLAKELVLASLPPGESIAGLNASIFPSPLRLDGAWIPGRPGRLVIQFEPLDKVPSLSLPMNASVDRSWRVRRWFVPN